VVHLREKRTTIKRKRNICGSCVEWKGINNRQEGFYILFSVLGHLKNILMTNIKGHFN